MIVSSAIAFVLITGAGEDTVFQNDIATRFTSNCCTARRPSALKRVLNPASRYSVSMAAAKASALSGSTRSRALPLPEPPLNALRRSACPPPLLPGKRSRTLPERSEGKIRPRAGIRRPSRRSVTSPIHFTVDSRCSSRHKLRRRAFSIPPPTIRISSSGILPGASPRHEAEDPHAFEHRTGKHRGQ